jgi:hypothetical protein
MELELPPFSLSRSVCRKIREDIGKFSNANTG